MLRIGHKGADGIVAGNTVASFRAAIEAGVDVIEFDVVRPETDFADGRRWTAASAGPADGRGPLLVAHDWAAARLGEPPTLAEALDAFAEPPLDRVRIDLDLKTIGREDEVVAALRERGLVSRAMVSTMEVPSLVALRELAPELERGWTVPRVRRDWRRSRWARSLVVAGLAAHRRRLPGVVRRGAAKLGVWAVWVHHPLITARLLAAADEVDVAVIAWTVDSKARMRELVALGVDGIVSNDPRLFAAL